MEVKAKEADEGSEGENIPSGLTIDGKAGLHSRGGTDLAGKVGEKIVEQLEEKAEEKKEEGELQFEAGKENEAAAEKPVADKALVDSEIIGNDTEGIADDLG